MQVFNLNGIMAEGKWQSWQLGIETNEQLLLCTFRCLFNRFLLAYNRGWWYDLNTQTYMFPVEFTLINTLIYLRYCIKKKTKPTHRVKYGMEGDLSGPSESSSLRKFSAIRLIVNTFGQFE